MRTAGKFNSSSYLMTVAELIEKLQEFHPNTPVWVSSDEEGNNFESLWQVSLFDTMETEDYGNGESDTWVKYDNMEEVAKEHKQIVMLWP